MKVIKINTSVNLTSGLTIPSGSICTISEGYADIKSLKEGLIPCQIATFLFANEQAMLEGKSPIQGVSDFNTTFAELKLNITDYQTESAESLLINVLEKELVKIYGSENIESIEL